MLRVLGTLYSNLRQGNRGELTRLLGLACRLRQQLYKLLLKSQCFRFSLLYAQIITQR